MTLDHGERYGKLTVLGKVEGTKKYLTKGRVKACLKCSSPRANGAAMKVSSAFATADEVIHYGLSALILLVTAIWVCAS